MAINIRRASEGDLNVLHDIFKKLVNSLAYYNDQAKQNEIKKYSVEELKHKINEDPDSVLVAEEDRNILGFCFSRLDDMLIWIEWFGVVEPARKKGVARSLVAHLESTANGRNAHKVWCDCRTENMKSINLLSTSGYQPICTVKKHWYGQDFILWQKEISVLDEVK